MSASALLAHACLVSFSSALESLKASRASLCRNRGGLRPEAWRLCQARSRRHTGPICSAIAAARAS